MLNVQESGYEPSAAQSAGSPAVARSASATPVPPSDPKLAIAEKEEAIRQAQFELGKMKSEQTAAASFNTDLTTLNDAYDAALEKLEPVFAPARELLELEAEIAERLAPELVDTIKEAVKNIDDEIKSKRDEVAALNDTLSDQSATEISAKATTANAKATSAIAKKAFGELAKSIDAQAAVVRNLTKEAQDAESKGMDSVAFLVIRELAAALDKLESLKKSSEVDGARSALQKAWDAEKQASVAEADATWSLGITKENLKKAQDALASLEKDRRKRETDIVAADAPDDGPLETTVGAAIS